MNEEKHAGAAVIVAILAVLLMLAIVGVPRAASAGDEELWLGAGALGLGLILWQSDAPESEGSGEYRAALLGGILQPLLAGFIEEGGISEERIGEVLEDGLPLVAGFLEARAGRILQQLRTDAREKDDAAILATLEAEGMEALGQWIVANGGWRRLLEELEGHAPLLARSLYRELPDDRGAVTIEGVLPEAIEGLYAQGRLELPTAEALWNARGSLSLTSWDALWFVESLGRNLERVDALQEAGLLPQATLYVTSEEWLDAGSRRQTSDIRREQKR